LIRNKHISLCTGWWCH